MSVTKHHILPARFQTSLRGKQREFSAFPFTHTTFPFCRKYVLILLIPPPRVYISKSYISILLAPQWSEINRHVHVLILLIPCILILLFPCFDPPEYRAYFDPPDERWGAGVETQKNVRGEIGGWGRVPFNEPYAPSLSAIYDGA